VLVLRARHAHVDELGAHGLELRLRLGHVDLRRHAARETLPRERELLLEIGDRIGEQPDLGVEAAQSEIVGSHLGVQSQIHAGEIGGAGLCVGARLLHGAADAAPEIRLPARLRTQNKVVGVGGAGGAGLVEERLVGGNFLRRIGNAAVHGGKEIGARHGDLLARGLVGFQGLPQLHISGGDALFELIELRILVDLPPVALEHAVGGIGRLPSASLRIGGRHYR
jgi:hypothetical protein